MSVYRDVASGKWFNTLAELKAFQRGEVDPPPKPEPIQEPIVEKEEEVVEEDGETLEVPAEEPEEKVKKTRVRVHRDEELPTFEDIGMDRIQLFEWLDSHGFYDRKVRDKGDRQLIKFYLSKKELIENQE